MQGPGHATGPGSPTRPVAPRQGASAAPSTSSGPVRGQVAGTAYLTARECQVLRLIAVGRSTADIARDLSVSVHTVKSHVSRMAQRVGVPDRAALVAVGIRARVIPVKRTPGISLDPAERHLVGLIGQGLANQVIAKRLRVSVPTAEYRVKTLMRRVGAVDRAHLVLLAAQSGFSPAAGGAP